MSQYPEHDKLRAIKGDNDIIASFLEWLQDKKTPLVLCDYTPHTELHPTRFSIEQVLAIYFDIDLKKLSDEKDRMVEAMQAANNL